MYLRMAQCFYELGRKWEAIVLYRDILDRWPTDPNREQAMFAMLVAYAEVERNDTALKYCRQFLKDFPTSKNAATVGFLTGATALQSQDPAAAETYFGTMLQSGTDSQFKEEMQFLIANARMMQGKNDEAITGYRDYLKANPSGTHVEEAEYRIALSTMLKGQYGEAVDLLNAYVKKYPSGFFVADSEYRMLIASYAERDFTNVVSAAEAWEQRHPSDQQLGEVIALKADALSANQREDDAAVAYARAAKVATTDEVLNYAIFEANKSLQKQREWDKVIALWTDFLKDRPNHPLQVSAVYWIAAAQVKQGKEDEARKYVADTVATYIGDPDREAVEQLLSQLAQLCAKKKRPRDKDGNFIDPATLPAPPDPATALDDLLRPAVQRMAQAAKEGAAPPVQADPALAAAAFGGAAPTNAPPPVVAFNENTAKARMLYAKAELATFRRRASDATNYYDQIATSFKPEDLSPWLLGKIGDHALATGQTNQAAAFYRQLLDDFPKASVVDFAYAGLSDIAYRNQDYATALKYCDDALDRGVVGFKAKEIDLGRARALQATDKLEDARKAFEAIASNKNYRGEATAEAVFHLGEIAEKQGKLPEANAYYQRVYVAYRKYLPWVARSYLRSGKVFEAVGDKKGALNTYNEMMREEKLQTFPEAAEIRARINQLEPQVQAAGKA
jgi:TolA-binding protein